MKKVKNITELASLVARLEGKKSKVKIGDVREILRILSDLSFEDTTVLKLIYANGKRRGKKK